MIENYLIKLDDIILGADISGDRPVFPASFSDQEGVIISFAVF